MTGKARSMYRAQRMLARRRNERKSEKNEAGMARSIRSRDADIGHDDCPYVC